MTHNYSKMSHKSDNQAFVPNFDIAKYMGIWWEIGKIPMKWETYCHRARAYYEWNDETQKIIVINTCFLKDNTNKSRMATAIVDSSNSHPGRFLLNFDDGLPADEGWHPYWVLWTDYNYSIVGHPDKTYLWILSREKQINRSTLRTLLSKAKSFGYNTDKLVGVPDAISN
jgi:apolipoprotein D and lipocalin family protein